VKSLPTRLLLVVAGGLLAGLAFEPFALAFLLPVAVAALTLGCEGATLRRGFVLGTAFGLAFMLLLLPWLRVIGTDAWIALSAFEALYYGLCGAATVAVRRLPGWPVWAAAVWVGVELLRGTVPFGGFPWGRLSFAVADTPVAPAFAYVGAAGTTYLVALVGTVLAWTVIRLRAVPLRAVGALVAACVLASLASAFPVHQPDPAADHDSVTVAAVQGNVPGEGMNAFAERRAVLDNHVAATLRLAERIAAGEVRRPDVVIWPENSTDIDPFADSTVFEDIQRAVDAVGVPVLVGALSRGPDQEGPYRNVGIVWSPRTGPGETYAKRHLVPYGEYIPMRDVLSPYISRLALVGSDKQPGTEPGVLEINGAVVGDVICFEIAYDEVVREAAPAGTQLLVVQTNNATYMGTGQIEQQFAIARLRAIETGRPVVVAATNGITGIVAPTGEVVERAPVRSQAVLTATVLEPVTSQSWALRIGRWVEISLVLIAAVAALAGLGGRHRRRPPGPDRTAPAARRTLGSARTTADRALTDRAGER
jgi:apolipoprotein N-acyltransferase